MKKKLMLAVGVCFLLIVSGIPTVKAGSVDISGSFNVPTSNILGLTVDPSNNHIILSSSYFSSFPGYDNLWEFTQSGFLVNSTKASALDGVGISTLISSIDLGSNDNLFALHYAEYKVDGITQSDHNLIEVNKPGDTLLSSFSTNQYYNSGQVFGLTYDSTSDHLFLATGRVSDEFILRETLLDGTVLNSFVLNG